MPGPPLEYVCRSLIQSVRGKMAETSARSVLVAMHTSVDARQATTDPHPGDPVLLTFPCVLLGVPTLIEDLQRRQPLGFAVYRNRDRARLTMTKEPYPRFYDLIFKVRIESQRLTGDAGILALLQAITAWAQESPRVAGLITEWNTTFVPDDEPELGDIVGATGHIRLRDWPCYGAPPKTIKLVATTAINIVDGSPALVAWQPEDSFVSDTILAAFQPADALGPIAIGAEGAAIARTVEGVWYLDAPTNTTAELRGLWGTSATNLVAVGTGGTILRRQLADSAITWLPDASPTRVDLNGVWGASAADLYAIGDGGMVLHFDGSSWALAQELSPAVSLRAIWGDAMSGRLWVGGDGGVIFRRDPDTSWSREITNVPAPLFAIAGDASGQRYAAGDAGVLLTSAGDGVWHPLDGVGSGQANTLRAACALGDDIFIAGDFGMVLHRTPSGWKAERTQSQSDFYALTGSGPEDVYAAGEGGVILHRARR
jgi:hypothetical protein